MKLGFGFVSNSSSASFVLRMENLTDEQISAIDEELGEPRDTPIKKYIEMYDLTIKDPGDGHEDHWNCVKCPGEIRGDTWMDNGYLEEWFRELKIPQSEYELVDDQLIDWEEYED